MTTTKIEFIDLQSQRQALGARIPAVLDQVLTHGGFILGPEVDQLERDLVQYTGAADCISCSNGTDALRLVLLAHQVGPGDAVFVPTFTFASTAEVVAQANATPVFVDVCPDTFNLDPQSLAQALEKLDPGLKPKGIIAVDLFGLPADYDAIQSIADQHGLWVMADAAQSFGGGYHNKKVGNLAHTTSTSFFPSKPLACYGDGGAIFTTDPSMSALIRSLRNHGCGTHRYDHIHIGLNSRLDTLQAAILIEKLKIFPAELTRRKAIAAYYQEHLAPYVTVPNTPAGYEHAWGLYTMVVPADKRQGLIDHLQAAQVPSNVYYRKPLHLQPAYEHFPRAQNSLIHAERLTNSVLSLPMHPYLTDNHVERIVETVKAFF